MCILVCVAFPCISSRTLSPNAFANVSKPEYRVRRKSISEVR